MAPKKKTKPSSKRAKGVKKAAAEQTGAMELADRVTSSDPAVARAQSAEAAAQIKKEEDERAEK